MRTKLSPATQMRLMLVSSRRSGVPFERAWESAWRRVRWPHDTTHRREFKVVLLDTREEWEAAYNRTGTSRRALAAVYSLAPDELVRAA